MFANPQATAGIRLNQVPTLIGDMMEDVNPQKIYNPKETKKHPLSIESSNPIEHKELPGAALAARQAITWFKKVAVEQKIELPEAFGSEALVGLISLIHTYLKKAEGTQVRDYPKSLFPLLGISNFAAMFRMLPEDDQAPFKQEPQMFVLINLQAANMSGTGGKSLFTKGFAEQLSNTTQEESEHAAQILGSISRADWLAPIPGGQDILTRAFTKSIKQDVPSLESLGKFDYGEKVGKKPKSKEMDTRPTAPILELRRLRQQVPISEWKDFALDIFDYIVMLNNEKNKSTKKFNNKK
jgi:hypothetical protein